MITLGLYRQRLSSTSRHSGWRCCVASLQALYRLGNCISVVDTGKGCTGNCDTLRDITCRVDRRLPANICSRDSRLSRLAFTRERLGRRCSHPVRRFVGPSRCTLAYGFRSAICPVSGFRLIRLSGTRLLCLLRLLFFLLLLCLRGLSRLLCLYLGYLFRRLRCLLIQGRLLLGRLHRTVFFRSSFTTGLGSCLLCRVRRTERRVTPFAFNVFRPVSLQIVIFVNIAFCRL